MTDTTFAGTQYEGLDPTFARACADADRRHALRRRLAENQMRVLGLRSRELALRVACSDIEFIDAVDMAYSAAVECGLVNSVGDDIVQQILSAAFGKIPEEVVAWQND